MGDIQEKLENIRGILSIADEAFDTVNKGVEIIDGVKKGSIVTNFKQASDIENATYRMKKKFYLFWMFLIVVTVVLFILI